MADDPSVTVVTMSFEAPDQGPAAEHLLAVLARYVVVSRGHDGCRNIDLCASATHPGRYVVLEKWESQGAQRAHFDSAEMVAMADACRGLLTHPPDIDLLDGISAHDLA